jgi:RimJ/RimL family protein N-acetyltransferase
MLQTRECEKSTGEAATTKQSPRGQARLATDVRPLTNDDRGRVLTHLLRLSAQDRQMRFCQSFSDAQVIHYVANIDFAKSACFGIVDEGEELIALVQSFAYDDGGVRMLEAAFSTDASARCQGLGTLLFHQVTDHAVEQRIDRVIAQCLAGNRPMRALLRAVDAVCEVEDGEVTGRLEVAGHA